MVGFFRTNRLNAVSLLITYLVLTRVAWFAIAVRGGEAAFSDDVLYKLFDQSWALYLGLVLQLIVIGLLAIALERVLTESSLFSGKNHLPALSIITLSALIPQLQILSIYSLLCLFSFFVLWRYHLIDKGQSVNQRIFDVVFAATIAAFLYYPFTYVLLGIFLIIPFISQQRVKTYSVALLAAVIATILTSSLYYLFNKEHFFRHEWQEISSSRSSLVDLLNQNMEIYSLVSIVIFFVSIATIIANKRKRNVHQAVYLVFSLLIVLLSAIFYLFFLSQSQSAASINLVFVALLLSYTLFHLPKGLASILHYLIVAAILLTQLRYF